MPTRRSPSKKSRARRVASSLAKKGKRTAKSLLNKAKGVIRRPKKPVADPLDGIYPNVDDLFEGLFPNRPSYYDDDPPIDEEEWKKYEERREKEFAEAARRLAKRKAIMNATSVGDPFDFFLNPVARDERAMMDAATRSLTAALRR